MARSFYTIPRDIVDVCEGAHIPARLAGGSLVHGRPAIVSVPCNAHGGAEGVLGCWAMPDRSSMVPSEVASVRSAPLPCAAGTRLRIALAGRCRSKQRLDPLDHRVTFRRRLRDGLGIAYYDWAVDPLVLLEFQCLDDGRIACHLSAKAHDASAQPKRVRR